jgi:WD40 repeat protein
MTSTAEEMGPTALEPMAPIPGGLPSRYFGDYEILDEIARGAMGIVYRARQLSLNRLVAIKMVLDGPLASPGFIARFQIEAESAAKLTHPNIVPIYEIGEHQGRHFFTMRLLEGGSLAQRMDDFRLSRENREQSQQRQREIARLMAMVARAMQHAHERGILHRDLKPANIMLDEEGQPHITDFGLAKAVETDCFLTQTGAILGTPAYMAPEQATGQAGQITTAADIYSFGAILYHLLAGKPPFQGASALDTLRQVLEVEPVSPVKINPTIDHDLATICLQCLAKPPVSRYSSARALAQDLECWLNGETIIARPATRTEQLFRWCRRKPVLAGLIAAVILLLTAVAVISTVAAVRIEKSRQVAIGAEEKATRQLWSSYVAQAKAQRSSGRPGRRFDSLRAITNAAAIRRSVELRNEAIACLALTDLRPITGGPETTNRNDSLLIDFPRNRYAIRSAGEVTIHDLASKTRLLEIPRQSSGVVWIHEFSPDGRCLWLSYSNKTSLVWDLTDLSPGMVWTNEINSDAFSPDSTRVAISTPEARIDLLDLHSGHLLEAIDLPSEVDVMFWAPNGRQLAGIGERQIVIVDFGKGSQPEIRSIHLPWQPMMLAWHPDSARIAVGGDDRGIHVFDSKTTQQVASLIGHKGVVTWLTFNPEGSLIASDSWDGRLRLWDFMSGKELISTPGGPEKVEFSPDGRRLAVYSRSSSRVNLFEIAPNEQTINLFDTNNVQFANDGEALIFAPDESWLAGNTDGAMTFWEPRSGKVLARFDGVPCFSLQPIENNGSVLGWNSNRMFRVALAQGISVHPEPFVPSIPEALKGRCAPQVFSRMSDGRAGVSADGRIFARAIAGHCYILDTQKKEVQAVTQEQYWMKYVAVSPNGRWVATGGWHYPNVVVWSALDGHKLKELPTGMISPNVAFSPDNRFLVTATGGEYRFWRVWDWTPTRAIARPGDDDMPGVMAFTRDGKMLAVTDTRQTIHLLAPDTGEMLAQLEPLPESEIISMVFNSDGSKLAVSRVDLPPQIWNLKGLRQKLGALGLDW